MLLAFDKLVQLSLAFLNRSDELITASELLIMCAYG